MAERIEPAARVYAEALYAAARDAGRTREVDSDLKALISGLGGNRPLVQALANPAIPRDAKKRVLMTLLADSDPLVRNAVVGRSRDASPGDERSEIGIGGRALDGRRWR